MEKSHFCWTSSWGAGHMILTRPPYLYLAAPLFNEMERDFNTELAKHLEQFFRVFLPQRDGGLMIDMVKAGVSPETAAQRVFRRDILAIEECDLLMIVLDGRTVDEGAAFELGYAHALGKCCYGLQTDIRRLLGSRNNPMIEGCLERVFRSVSEVLEWANSFAEMKSHLEKQRTAI
jgi:nucleoside 2-deoxyribosyltransferase